MNKDLEQALSKELYIQLLKYMEVAGSTKGCFLGFEIEFDTKRVGLKLNDYITLKPRVGVIPSSNKNLLFGYELKFIVSSMMKWDFLRIECDFAAIRCLRHLNFKLTEAFKEKLGVS